MSYLIDLEVKRQYIFAEIGYLKLQKYIKCCFPLL